jgi:hypothetical protein
MISSLQSEERVNRSHSADLSSAQIASACFIGVAKRDQQSIACPTFPPQTALRQRRDYEAAPRRRVHVIINRRFSEA